MELNTFRVPPLMHTTPFMAMIYNFCFCNPFALSGSNFNESIVDSNRLCTTDNIKCLNSFLISLIIQLLTIKLIGGSPLSKSSGDKAGDIKGSLVISASSYVLIISSIIFVISSLVNSSSLDGVLLPRRCPESPCLWKNGTWRK